MWIESTASGKYKACERYTDPISGKTKKATVTLDKDTKAARKAAEEALRAKIEQILSFDPTLSDPTLAELLKYYIEYQKKTGIQPNTYARNQVICQQMINLLGPTTKARSLTARMITSKLLSADIENSTRNTYLTRFRAMLRWAYKNDYIESAEFLQKIDRFPDDKAREKIEEKYLEPEEVKALLEGMKIPRWRLLTEFLVLSGLRIGEALALDDKDVTDVISVTKTMDIMTMIRKDRTKTDSSTREVFIQPELKEVVDRIRLYVKKDKVRNQYLSGLFFPASDGGFIQYAGYRVYLGKVSASVIHHKITPHALRHTHVSILAAKGVSFEAIARRVGHEDSKITKDIYFHVTRDLVEHDKEEIRKIRIL